MRRTIFQYGPGFLLLVVAPILASATSYQGSFERSYTVSGTVDLEVLTRSGDITVQNGPAGTVTVRGKIYVGDRWFGGNHQSEVNDLEKNPPIRQNGNLIHIDNVASHEIAIDYEITVPTDTNVRTRSGSGDQRVEGLSGKVNLESGSGDMRLRDIGNELRVQTGSGDVDGHGISAAFNVECGSGDIRIDTSGEGDARVRTGSGNVELHGVKGGLEAESGSGDITIFGNQTSAWEVRTASGDVELQLQPGAAFDLDASAGSGNVIVDGPVTMTVQGDLRKSRHSIQGKVGGGGPLLTVRTSSGDVHIH
jgi:hypothetical protein